MVLSNYIRVVATAPATAIWGKNVFNNHRNVIYEFMYSTFFKQ